MSITDALSRISLIQQQIVQLQSGQLPSAAAAAQGAAAAAGATPSAVAPTSFSDALAQATDTAPSTFPTSATAGLVGVTPAGTASGGVPLPAAASSMLTSNQQQFAGQLAAQTGLNPGVISAWLLAEESGGAAQSRQATGNNDWLNIGYTDSGTYGSADSVWSDPITAANATAGWLKGQDTIPGYGAASSGIQAILSTVGQTPAAQIAALQHSGWASSGYPDLPALYGQLAA